MSAEDAGLAYQIVDAFSERPYAGNPAGVVLDAQGLTAEQMQRVARELNASETVFAGAPAEDGLPVRYFTPTQEVDFCGHASLALGVAWALDRRPGAEALPGQLTLATRAGAVPVELRPHPTCQVEACMTQARPRFADFGYRLELLAGALGLEVAVIPPGWPLGLAYTGLWALVVPVISVDALARARPDFVALADLNRKLGCASTHLYTLTGDASLVSRDFSPAVGVPEDPVTGSALGATAALLLKEGALRKTPPVTRVSAEQGASVGRPGQARIELAEDVQGQLVVRVAGTAVPVARGALRRP
ncbi:MAG TPA: PhzF family phenazine biosynthesis protein [Myxococcota bacterium]|nr:PhzF family phenazine biosynthesis protein [Myxococcota bacterium]HRY96682.1 PhzF family phenazine biosynthesis protein [Myxococcota bacterium]HSA20580.1 PhzF family phenazine biosynthesis protein [Myxococcota bacterium]